MPDNIGEVFYSFDFKDYNRLVKFKNFCDLKVILSQVYNFNYYIFDNSNEFILAWGDDEVLMGGGEAAKWVENVKGNWRF
ncbi:hypothetical protein NQU59_11960 [Acinetobacter colistiniresistens]|uniref:hypothetical protein n=1 Tax=Acinetobacter colistiniresistens TaxID=280145 RepID=UPI00211C0E22|nr:hypothetical protein [Acinetobacter colistiniresistens]UUM26409.1 hypothetical protein NQU59_11960 [Acinetobacter colistiniresistens]